MMHQFVQTCAVVCADLCRESLQRRYAVKLEKTWSVKQRFDMSCNCLSFYAFEFGVIVKLFHLKMFALAFHSVSFANVCTCIHSVVSSASLFIPLLC